MVDKRIEKLKSLSVSKKELEGLLRKFGFEISGGKGSHTKWTKTGLPAIVVASHKKEVPQYQLKQVIAVLEKADLLEGDENEE